MPPAAATGRGATASTTAHQRECRNFSGNVPPGFYALRDYYIDIRLDRALRVDDRTDLMKNFAAASVHAIDRRARSPQKNETIGTRSRRRSPTCSSTGKCKIKFTPNGLSVSSRTR